MGKLLRAITDDGLIKASVFDSTDVVFKAKKIHNLTNTACAALGRTLTAAVLMSSNLKDKKDRISLHIKSDGEIGSIFAESYKTGEVKGFVTNPNVDLPLRSDGKIDVGGALGHSGTINVVKDVGLSEPQTGTVELLNGEIAEDISYYYMQSEQIPTVVGLGVLLSKDGTLLGAGGYLVQLMPGYSQKTIEDLEKSIKELPKSVSMFFAQDKNPKILLDTLFKETSYKIIEDTLGVFKCDCSLYRTQKAIISLGKNEIEKMIEEDKEFNVSCHYCKKNYTFTKHDLITLLELAK